MALIAISLLCTHTQLFNCSTVRCSTWRNDSFPQLCNCSNCSSVRSRPC